MDISTSDNLRKITTQCNFTAFYGGTPFTVTSNPITFFSAGKTQVSKRIGRVKEDYCEEISYPKNHLIPITYCIKLDKCILSDQNTFILEDPIYNCRRYGHFFTLQNVYIWINGIQKNYLYNDNKPIIIPTNELQSDCNDECNIIIESSILYWHCSKQPIAFFAPFVCKLIRSAAPYETNLPCEVIGVGVIIDSSLLIRKYLRSVELLDNCCEIRTYQIIYENTCNDYPVYFFSGCIAARITDDERVVSLQSDNMMHICRNYIQCSCTFPICPNETFSFSYQTLRQPD